MNVAAENLPQGVEDLSKYLGRTIKRHRIWNDLSQRKLARLADISLTYLRLIELGKHDPSIRILAKIAKVLNVQIWQLLKEAEEEQAKEDGNGT